MGTINVENYMRSGEGAAFKQIKIVESPVRKGTYKVFVANSPDGFYYLRQGHAWKTRTGAVKAAKKFLGI